MKHTDSIIGIAATLILTGFVPTRAQQSSPPAPPPGSPGIYLTAQQLAEKMQASLAKQAEPALSPIGVTDQYFINEVHRGKVGPPAVHPGWTELHIILDGGGTFVTGGKIVTLPGGAGKAIEGGVSRKVAKGDAIIVPADTPHWYKELDGSLTAIEVRFIAPPTAAAPK